MAEYEEMVRLVDGAYKNILEKFNPCARQLIAAGKTYLKALHAAVAASKGYMDAISRLARHAHQATWGGCTDIGTALMQLVDVQKEIENQQMNVLKAFYVDVIVPLESNIEKDAKVVASEQKRFMQQQKTHHESYLKIASLVKKQRKKSRAGNRGSNVDKEIKQMQSLEEEKGKLDGFCESSLKQSGLSHQHMHTTTSRKLTKRRVSTTPLEWNHHLETSSPKGHSSSGFHSPSHLDTLSHFGSF